MNTTISFDPTNPDEVAAAAATIALFMGDSAGQVEDDAAEKKKKAAAEKKKKAAAEKKKKAEEEAAAKKAAEEEEAAASESKYDRDQVRQALKDHAALEGKDAAIQILKDNGAASIGELAEDKFEDVMTACGEG